MIHRVGERLAPHMIRAKLFGRRWRGFDPGQVSAYLDRMADELASLDRELTGSRREAGRLGSGPGLWQTRHVSSRFTDPTWWANGRRR